MKYSSLFPSFPRLAAVRPSFGRLSAGLLLFGALSTAGCLQRDVKKDSPNTSNVFVEQIANTAISEIDLLFVIDNSVSMGDKQDILRKAVPQMVSRLVNPLCLDGEGNSLGNSNGGECANGAAEFSPVNDIHIGVITSSLGGHGSNNCPRDQADKFNDDQGLLIPAVRSVTNGGTAEGFLTWNGEGQDSGLLISSFEEHVVAAGENGCGFEAPLEAWYRFLVDPSPPAEIVVGADDVATSTGVNQAVLDQREAFLRPEGLVAIVVLTDENDCSAMDGGVYYNNAGFGYLVAATSIGSNTFHMPIATSQCEANPNDKCCFSCLAQSAPSGCEDAFAQCDGSTLSAEDDRANVRCFDNKRRFGVDLLYPTSRYVEGLTRPTIVDAQTGQTVDNPLLRGAGPSNLGKVRDPGLVFFAGIVGVPWQDIATEASRVDGSAVMEYLTAAELSVANVAVSGGAMVDRWDVMLGQPGLPELSQECAQDDGRCGAVPVPPFDPFMIESIGERDTSLANPISGDAIMPSSSTDPRANNINGHEADHFVTESGVDREDLQYACTFELAQDARKENCGDDDGSCDCKSEPSRNRPLCQPPGGGAATNTQYYGKAYPGTRILQVLKDFGANSIVGSICPKNAIEGAPVDVDSPYFGYNPAVQAIVDRLAEKLTGKCLPRELSIEDDGSVPCAVVEAKPSGVGDPLDCTVNGRLPVEGAVRAGVEAQLRAVSRCDGKSGTSCSTYEMCVIRELLPDETPEGREECLLNDSPAVDNFEPGFCYIDPAKVELDEEGNVIGYPAGGNAEGTNPLVDNCPATERRLLRFVGKDTPASNTVTFVACTGDAASADQPIPVAPDATAPEEM